MEEIWVSIKWNNIQLYASNMGQIKDEKGRIKHQNQSFRYNRVNVKGKKELVHRIVATAFIPNPDNLETVNHIDGDRRNNQASNLEWCTMEENYMKTYARANHPLYIAQKNFCGETLAIFKSQREAERVTGVHHCAINMCCAGRRKTAGGFCWSYTE